MPSLIQEFTNLLRKTEITCLAYSANLVSMPDVLLALLVFSFLIKLDTSCGVEGDKFKEFESSWVKILSRVWVKLQVWVKASTLIVDVLPWVEESVMDFPKFTKNSLNVWAISYVWMIGFPAAVVRHKRHNFQSLQLFCIRSHFFLQKFNHCLSKYTCS